MKTFLGMRVFPRQLRSDADYIESAYQRTHLYERWGKTLGFFFLGLALLQFVFGFVLGVLAFQIPEFLFGPRINQPGMIDVVLASVSTSVGFGFLAGLSLSSGLGALFLGVEIFQGDRKNRLLVKYHEALESMVDEREEKVSSIEEKSS